MAGRPGVRLGIDFGTSHTVAALAGPDGQARPLRFESSFLLPSAVYADVDGRLLVGRDAERSARLDPARYEPNPKRRIDDGVILLGTREVGDGKLVSNEPTTVVDIRQVVNRDLVITVRGCQLRADLVRKQRQADVYIAFMFKWPLTGKYTFQLINKSSSEAQTAANTTAIEFTVR